MYITHKYRYILWNRKKIHISFYEKTEDRVISSLFSLLYVSPGVPYHSPRT